MRSDICIFIQSTFSLKNTYLSLSFRSYSEADMPGSVPAYDPTEQQLLASIEREMGVLF